MLATLFGLLIVVVGGTLALLLLHDLGDKLLQFSKNKKCNKQ